MAGGAARRRLAVLLCLPLVCALAATADAASPPIAQPDYSIYLKKEELLRKVEELVKANPSTMRIEIKHAEDEGYSADLQVVTIEPAGLSSAHQSKARLLMDFGEHGREYISSEVGLRLLQVLSDEQQLAGMLGSSKGRLARLQTILKQTVLQVLPMENVNGRSLVEDGALCERKNGRGVDTNRNWDIDWGKKEKDYDPREEFPGRAPLSEPEVQILLSLAKDLKPHVWLNVHSGMYALFTPYDHKAEVPNSTDARAALRLLHRIKELSCPQCVVGSGGRSVGYLAHGTGTDYMYERLGVPLSFTWEIYGDQEAPFEDCFRMFNPLGREHFEAVVVLWVKALLQLLELLPSHPAVWPAFRGLGLDGGAAAAAAEGGPGAIGGAAEHAQEPQQPQQQEEEGKPSQQQQQQQPEGAAAAPPKQQGAAAAAAAATGDEGQGAPGGGGGEEETLSVNGSSMQWRQGHLAGTAGTAEEPGMWELLLRGHRPLPLLLSLVGIGVFLYFATRSPPGAQYSKIAGGAGRRRAQ